MNPVESLRRWLRRQRRWREFQELRREGLRDAWRRRRIQAKILGTPPVRTSGPGPVEVRVLTWRRDWLNVIWALKSYYHFAGVDYPLFIHDGGLGPGQAERLLRHFPDATFIPSAEADARIAEHFTERGLTRCREYRLLNPSTRKLFDFFAFSGAETLISIDSDIVFFRRPELLVVPPGGYPRNLYNEDRAFWYSMTPDAMEAAFGIRPPERINSGLSVIRRESIDFDAIEGWLAHPEMFANRWVTEQTLHALCSTRFGVEFLPPAYWIDTEPGLSPDYVCKHYPGYFRPLLYQEGMAHLIASGFLRALRTPPHAGADGPPPARAAV